MSTVTSSSLAVTSHNILPSAFKARQLSHTHETPPVGMPQHSVQGTTTGGAPPSSLNNNVVGNFVHAQTPNEQVEEGRMSRETSMVSTLPPYSPGEFQCGDGAPPSTRVSLLIISIWDIQTVSFILFIWKRSLYQQNYVSSKWQLFTILDAL